MDIRLVSTVVEIVAGDLVRSLDFYRLLGLAVPDTDSPHVEVDLPGGNKLLFGKVTEAGHRSTLDPFDAPWGQRYATVLDPDGNSIDLFAPLSN